MNARLLEAIGGGCLIAAAVNLALFLGAGHHLGNVVVALVAVALGVVALAIAGTA